MVEWRIVISREGLIALLAAKSQNSVEVFHKSKAPAAAALHLCLCTCAKKKKKKKTLQTNSPIHPPVLHLPPPLSSFLRHCGPICSADRRVFGV